jgi:hypothetical protein
MVMNRNRLAGEDGATLLRVIARAFGHLASSRISGAENQDSLFSGHEF